MKELSKHDLGNRITELRKLKGFSQEDLANAIAIVCRQRKWTV